MADQPIRLGIIGASADPWAWASTAHVPALKALPEFELVAVASRDQSRANEAAKVHGIERAYGRYVDMLACADLDMIVVSTSSEHHHRLVMPAIEAGKHVFCEWPFGRDIHEAREMRDAAAARGVRSLVGLQTRYEPIVAYVRDLIADGFLGTLWSADFHRANDQTARKAVSPEYLHFLETANAGLRILGGHALDTLACYIGELRDLQAYMAIGMDRLELVTGEIAPVTHRDHILVQGIATSGAVLSAMLKMNSPTFRPFHLELSGSNGGLVITTSSDLDPKDRHPGVPFALEMWGTSGLDKPFEPIPVPPRYRRVPLAVPNGQPVAVAHMYQDFAKSLRANEAFLTDFAYGVRHHELLATIEQAAVDGMRHKWADR